MKNQSLLSFNKISAQMDRLSTLFTKQQYLNSQIHKALNNNDLSSQSSSQRSISNMDIYFKQYDNPTTKSIPFQQQNSSNVHNYQQPTQIIDKAYRDIVNQINQECDKDNGHDDKSTVILLPHNYYHKKQKDDFQTLEIAKSHAEYNSIKLQHKNNKKDSNMSKNKNNYINNGMASMPSQVYINYQTKAAPSKKQSISKHNPIQSPNKIFNKLAKSNATEQQQNHLIKQLKNKLSKISKIDKDELTKLQQKKHNKKSDLSSNRKKTKRQLNKAKSSSNLKNNINRTNYISTNNLKTNKTIGNQSVKHFQNKKIDLKKTQQKVSTNYNWQKNQKIHGNNKKLNRVNIGKLQQNMKKINQKKYNAIKQLGRKLQKTKQKKHDNKQIINKDTQLKLCFTDQFVQSVMSQMIKDKQLGKEYKKQTQKYNDASNKISREYLSTLIKQCRQTSEQAILKLKLVALLIYFYDQFAKVPFTANCSIPLKHQDNFFTYISQQQIIEILLHPTKLIKIKENLPSILITDNIISSQRFQIFTQKFGQINDQLDQELQFFLIKKTNLYMFIHCLNQYMNFLLEKQLIGKTKRTKLVQCENTQVINGFYSSRSKKDEISKKYLKKNQGPYKMGYRCDSDRKITIQDQQMIFKMPVRTISKPQFSHKANPLKKNFK